MEVAGWNNDLPRLEQWYPLPGCIGCPVSRAQGLPVNTSPIIPKKNDSLIKKTRPGRGKSSSPISHRADTQGAHNPLMAKKLRNQQFPVEKTPEP
jgi:hypothetical protein